MNFRTAYPQLVRKPNRPEPGRIEKPQRRGNDVRARERISPRSVAAMEETREQFYERMKELGHNTARRTGMESEIIHVFLTAIRDAAAAGYEQGLRDFKSHLLSGALATDTPEFFAAEVDVFADGRGLDMGGV